jgi:hypothetical protein
VFVVVRCEVRLVVTFRFAIGQNVRAASLTVAKLCAHVPARSPPTIPSNLDSAHSLCVALTLPSRTKEVFGHWRRYSTLSYSAYVHLPQSVFHIKQSHNGNKALTPGLRVVLRIKQAVFSRAVGRYQNSSPRFRVCHIQSPSCNAVFTAPARAFVLRLIRCI